MELRPEPQGTKPVKVRGAFQAEGTAGAKASRQERVGGCEDQEEVL